MNTAHQQDRVWADEAVRRINAENNRSADTHLYAVPLPEHWGVQLYLKDESTHRTGSLKHRLARSLFLFGLVNGWIREGTTIVEASSGSTAVSEAYFAQLLGCLHRGDARTTSPEKIALIEQFGGSCHLVDHAAEVYEAAAELAAAPAATTWISSPTPSGPRTGAGTTTSPSRSSTNCPGGAPHPPLGGGRRRHRRDQRHDRPVLAVSPPRDELAVVDPENSAFYPGWRDSQPDGGTAPREGQATAATAAPDCRRGSRASAGRGWSRASCRP